MWGDADNWFQAHHFILLMSGFFKKFTENKSRTYKNDSKQRLVKMLIQKEIIDNCSQCLYKLIVVRQMPGRWYLIFQWRRFTCLMR
jgi:hypothetical protein